MFDFIEQSLERGDILSIGTSGFGDDTITNEYGLVMSHAYTVIDTYRLTTDGEESHRLIKMRNPWGSEYYDGRWCDYCQEWNNVYENRVDLVDEDDGIIFIEDVDLRYGGEMLFVNYKLDDKERYEQWIDFEETESNTWYSAILNNPV
jgi:hypothetical protein